MVEKETAALERRGRLCVEKILCLLPKSNQCLQIEMKLYLIHMYLTQGKNSLPGSAHFIKLRINRVKPELQLEGGTC